MKKNKALWWLFAVVIAVAIIAIAVHSGWKFIKKDLAKQPQQKSTVKPLLQDELKRMIIAASDSLYQIQFSSFLLNIDSGKGFIKGINLTADSGIYKKLVARHKAPGMMMNVHADSMVINDFKFADTKDGKQFVVKNMLLHNPVIHIDFYPQYINDTTANTSSHSLLFSAVEKLMQLSLVQHMRINNLDVEFVQHTGKAVKKTVMHNLDIAMDGMDIKKIKRSNSSQTATVINIASYRLTTADKLYNIHMRNISFYPEQGSAAITKTTIEPTYNKASFFQHVSKANDRFYFVYNNMKLQGIDMNKLLHRQQVKVNKMSVESSVTNVYTNYALKKRKPPLRKHAYPHELLQQLALDITVDTMLMHNGLMKYEMKTKKSDSIALFTMDGIETKIINLTNNKAAKQKNKFTTVTTSGKVMNAANITSVYRFNLNDKNGAFTMRSELSPMNGIVLNPLAKPLAMLEIRSLNIQKMITEINANENAATGNIDFYYKNMKIAFLKKKDEDFKKRKLLSWASNVFMPDDNPKRNGKFKKGPINIKRDETDSFFGLIWRATFAGMTTHITGIKKVDVESNH